ncbi:MAG: hypothetical protein KKB20_05895 [Proteobacteria bacterium]|nr:hypothetical protein [Pseudomonadota bacterium]
MKKSALFFLCLLLIGPATKAHGLDLKELQTLLTRKIPPRRLKSMKGSEFAGLVSAMNRSQREEAIQEELLDGNLPGFLRKLKPVRLGGVDEAGRPVSAIIFVMPDYLAIGSERDFLHIPMDLHSATRIAGSFGFILPTAKMVDQIYCQAAYQFRPEPMCPGPWMTSTPYYRQHDRKIAQQRLSLGCPLGALISGHKKDLVMTNRLVNRPGRVAIYGWHRSADSPIQPLSTVHGATYADYSHGVRLVSEIVLINGRPVSIYDILKNEALAPILCDEGAIPEAGVIMAGGPGNRPVPAADGEALARRLWARLAGPPRLNPAPAR